MLACVCQPADPGIFRRSPVPLGAPPLKIIAAVSGHRGATPKPGRIVRLYPPPPSSISNSNNSHERKSINDNISRKEQKETECNARKDPPKTDLNVNANAKKSTKEPISTKTAKTTTATTATTPVETKSCDRKSRRLSNKLPDGVQLTLNELREMACRQQAQIDSQHQLLAAKEQRLRYLKEQEARQQRVQAESDRLRRLRDRVDAQELKLRKLRALRGQVDHQKQNNISLTSDLDSIRALFNDKEKELSLAVAKVEELTRQLEELRRGRSSRDPPPPSALELDKLRRELMYRNKLNEQQNQRLFQQREALTARQEEMSAIDKRISELQERLHKKRILNQQLANQISAASHKAAYHQLVRLTGSTDQGNHQFARKPQNQQSNSLSRGNIAAVEPYNHVPIQNHQIRVNTNGQEHNSAYHPVYHQMNHIKKDQDSPNSNKDPVDINNKLSNMYLTQKSDDADLLKEFTVSKSDPKYQTLPYNTKFTVNLLAPNRTNKAEPTTNSSEKENENISANHINGNLNMQTVHSAPLNMVNKNIATPLSQHNLLARKNSEPFNGEEVNGKQKENYPVSSGNAFINYQKPISSVAPTSIHHSNILSNIYQTSSIKVQPVEPQTLNNPSKQPPTLPNHSPQLVLSPPQSTSTPLSTPEVNQQDKIPKPALPPKPAIKPPPRQTQQVSFESTVSVEPPPLPTSEPPEEVRKTSPPPPQKNPIKFTPAQSTEMIIKAKPLTIKKQPLIEQPKLRTSNSNFNKTQNILNRRSELPQIHFNPEVPNHNLNIITQQAQQEKSDSDASSPKILQETKDETDRASVEESEVKAPIDGVVRRCKKGNLKPSGKQNLSRRVSFDPLALLLDASLEGELELVKKTATQVTNPSAANDEGITALHNAICAGHIEIVKFLVEFGCDVNAQDSDGWTPLHCAASCNNVTMVKFLVEHGACIFATTLSDHETAAEKCEEDEEGFDGCSEYLYSVQEKLGILSGGVVYAVFDYTAQQADELSFKAGQQFTVLRKGDESEREWWWSKLGDKEGYVPRNLLGLYPRVNRSED